MLTQCVSSSPHQNIFFMTYWMSGIFTGFSKIMYGLYSTIFKNSNTPQKLIVLLCTYCSMYFHNGENHFFLCDDLDFGERDGAVGCPLEHIFNTKILHKTYPQESKIYTLLLL